MADTTDPRFSILVATALLGLTGCPQPDLSLGGQQQDACDFTALVGAQILASEVFERETGKPQVHGLPFQASEGDEVCVVVTTMGHDDPADKVAPASLVLDLDGEELFSPSDFDAKPRFLSRSRQGLAQGGHEVSVEVRGKPGSRVKVDVITRTPGTGAQSFGAILASRLEDPGSSATVVKDEAIIGFDAAGPTISSAEVSALLAQLPYPAAVVGELLTAPIFRIYLPGTEGGAELDQRLDDLLSLPGVEVAVRHQIGGLAPSILPDTGDTSYVDYVDQVATGFTQDAWHLERILAEDAWTDENVRNPITVGVMDTGFNVTHPGFEGVGASNIGACIGPVNNNAMQWHDCMQSPQDWEPPPLPAMPTAMDQVVWRHGTAVAGILGARGESTTVGNGFADTVGVVWETELVLASYNVAQITPNVPTIYDNAATNSGYAKILALDAMATGPGANAAQNVAGLAPVRVMNLSFGNAIFDQNNNPHSQNDMTRWRDEQAELFEIMLGAHRELLVVQAAGNNGVLCTGPNALPAFYCQAQTSGNACAVTDEELAKRVLCVAMSDNQDLIDGRSNHGGDALAAPAVQVGIMEFGVGIRNADGTSYAAPQVAGAAALMIGANPNIAPEIIHDVLLASGPTTAVYDNVDYRILNLAVAVQWCQNGYVNSDIDEDVCPSFSDIDESHWGYDAVHKLACDCVLQGYANGTFAPEQAIKRAEALKIVFELAFPGHGFVEPESEPLLDVPADAWYAKYVSFALELEDPEATSPIDFLIEQEGLQPGKAMTRAEFVQLLVEVSRYSCLDEFDALQQTYYQYLSFEQADPTPPVIYEDVDVNSDDEPSPHIYAATSRCLVSGYDNEDKFGPDDPLQRVAASKIGCLAVYGFGSGLCGEQTDACTPHTPMMVGPDIPACVPAQP